MLGTSLFLCFRVVIRLDEVVNGRLFLLGPLEACFLEFALDTLVKTQGPVANVTHL